VLRVNPLVIVSSDSSNAELEMAQVPTENLQNFMTTIMMELED